VSSLIDSLRRHLKRETNVSERILEQSKVTGEQLRQIADEMMDLHDRLQKVVETLLEEEEES